ncbi:MAG: hypothetical protein PVJ67_02620 [Candidatus Pacearchaeota archaeon]|jgi:ribosomal protein S3AE
MAIAKRKKKFFEVDMPIIRKETQLQAFEPKELVDRIIRYDLTRMNRGKGMLLQLKVKSKDDKLTTIPTALQLMPYYLKRMVRKGTNYVEDSFSADAKDSVIRIKPFLITRRKVSRAVRKALRNKAREELTKYLKSKSSEKIFEEVLKNHVQKTLSLKLKKIYPLSLCEIRILKVEKFIKDKVENKNMDEEKIENAAEEITKDVEVENVKEPSVKEEVKKEIEKEVEEVIEDVAEDKE